MSPNGSPFGRIELGRQHPGDRHDVAHDVLDQGVLHSAPGSVGTENHLIKSRALRSVQPGDVEANNDSVERVVRGDVQALRTDFGTGDSRLV
jgi:hypothetical protein